MKFTGAQIKKELAKHFNAKTTDFSANLEKFYRGTRRHVFVKSFDINLEEVRKFCKKYEEVNYDKDGFILSGWNHFVDVNYDRTLIKSELNTILETDPLGLLG